MQSCRARVPVRPRPSPCGVAAVRQREGVAVLPVLPGLLRRHLGTHSRVSHPHGLTVHDSQRTSGKLRSTVPQACSSCTGSRVSWAQRAGLGTCRKGSTCARGHRHPPPPPPARQPAPTQWNFRHRLSKVSSWLCRPTLGLYTVKCLPRFCSARRQLGLLARTGAGVRGRWGGGGDGACPSLPLPSPSPSAGVPPLGTCWGPPRATHLVGEVEAVVGARQLQGLGVSLVPFQAAVHADLQEHAGSERGEGCWDRACTCWAA